MRIHETSGGNRFYALEIARLLLERGQSVEPGRPLPDPEGLLGVLNERLGPLPAAVRHVLEAVAVLSEPTVDLVEAASASPGRAFEHLRAATRAGVVEVDGERVRFVQPLLSEAVLSAIGPTERRALHRRMAELVPPVRWLRAAAAFAASCTTAAISADGPLAASARCRAWRGG